MLAFSSRIRAPSGCARRQRPRPDGSIYLDAGGRLHGFRRGRSGEVTTIDAPGAIQTRVRGINNRGQIGHRHRRRQLVHHAFLFDRGRFTEIKPRRAAGKGSLATDVDDRGRVLGYIL
jgi:hypothetical protein